MDEIEIGRRHILGLGAEVEVGVEGVARFKDDMLTGVGATHRLDGRVHAVHAVLVVDAVRAGLRDAHNLPRLNGRRIRMRCGCAEQQCRGRSDDPELPRLHHSLLPQQNRDPILVGTTIGNALGARRHDEEIKISS
ncbi:hypothetical protein V1274_004471 [Bradyrhizobium sp. AZCC 1614]